MHEPIGVSGVQTVPNNLQSLRLLDAAQDRAAFAGRIVARRDIDEAEALFRVVAFVGGLEAQRAVGQPAEAAPFEGFARLENRRHLGLRLDVAAARHGADVLVLDLAASLVDLPAPASGSPARRRAARSRR